MDVRLTLHPSDPHLSDLLIYNHRATAGRSLSHHCVLLKSQFHPVEKRLHTAVCCSGRDVWPVDSSLTVPRTNLTFDLTTQWFDLKKNLVLLTFDIDFSILKIAHLFV